MIDQKQSGIDSHTRDELMDALEAFEEAAKEFAESFKKLDQKQTIICPSFQSAGMLATYLSESGVFEAGRKDLTLEHLFGKGVRDWKVATLKEKEEGYAKFLNVMAKTTLSVAGAKELLPEVVLFEQGAGNDVVHPMSTLSERLEHHFRSSLTNPFTRKSPPWERGGLS